MKKLISIVMVMALILAMGIPVFAADTGSITITNATVDKTYTIYKIFDATIKLGSGGEENAVAYSIEKDNQFFTPIFGNSAPYENTYFNYDPATGAVTKKASATDTDVINYLTTLIANGSYDPAVAPIKASTVQVEFKDLPYGYYLITSDHGSAVTIDSNTPNANVIDKNQAPGKDFDKDFVLEGDVKSDAPITANIGDKVDYCVSFEATNYDGDKQIKFYQVTDTYGQGLWMDFDSIKVTVGGVELTKGYHLVINTCGFDKEFLGEWGSTEQKIENADWYLLHLGANQFRITIPWLEGHKINAVYDSVDTTKVISYKVEFDSTTSKFTSPINVDIDYSMVVEANATIGGGASSNLINTAFASWTSEYETNTTSPESVEVKTYGIGVLKDDGTTHKNLAGAEFRLYRHECTATCNDPCTVTCDEANAVYLIPTDIKGVYIVDSKYATGKKDNPVANLDASRTVYDAYLEGYLNGLEKDNRVTTEINGKVVILGLAEGTYYLKETKAPDGYNSLSAPVKLLVTSTSGSNFTVYADGDGNVADIQEPDGSHTAKDYVVTHTVVHNSKGVELPSTGGQGTVWFIAIGTMLAIGFAVFLITHKKMSVYED